MRDKGVQHSNEGEEAKKTYRSSWKRRFAYFGIGLLIALGCVWVILNWMDIIGFLLGRPNLNYDRQPNWAKACREVVEHSAWIWILLIVLLRMRIGRAVRAVAFSLGILVGFYVMPIGFILWTTVGEEFVHQRSFDAALWREDADEDSMWPARLCMVDDLISSGRLDGLTRKQVVELLGTPDAKGFPFGAVDCDIHYHLGPERGFLRIDSESLFIKLDDDERVTRYWLYRD